MGAQTWRADSAVIVGAADWRFVVRCSGMVADPLGMDVVFYCCGKVRALLGDCCSPIMKRMRTIQFIHLLLINKLNRPVTNLFQFSNNFCNSPL